MRLDRARGVVALQFQSAPFPGKQTPRDCHLEAILTGLLLRDQLDGLARLTVENPKRDWELRSGLPERLGAPKPKPVGGHQQETRPRTRAPEHRSVCGFRCNPTRGAERFNAQPELTISTGHSWKLGVAMPGVETELTRKRGEEDAARLTGHWLWGASAHGGLCAG